MENYYDLGSISTSSSENSYVTLFSIKLCFQTFNRSLILTKVVILLNFFCDVMFIDQSGFLGHQKRNYGAIFRPNL